MASDIFSISSAFVSAVFHSDLGRRLTNTSESSIPMTSVATSGDPVLETTSSTSGKRRRSRSRRVVDAKDSDSEILGETPGIDDQVALVEFGQKLGPKLRPQAQAEGKDDSGWQRRSRTDDESLEREADRKTS